MSVIGRFRSEYHGATPAARAERLREILAGDLDAPTRFQVSDAAYAIDPVVTIEVLADLAARLPDADELRRFLVWHLLRQADFAEAKRHARQFAAISRRPGFWHEVVVRASLLMSPAEVLDGWVSSGPRLAPALRRATYAVAATLAGGNLPPDPVTVQWRQEVEAARTAALAADAARAPALRDLLAGLAAVGSVALVGNGPSLTGAGRGAAIDGFDAVVRVNFPPLAGRASDLGRRTDAVFFTETLFMGPHIEPLLDRDPAYREALIASFEGSTGAAEIAAPERRMADAGVRRYHRLAPRLRDALVAMTYDGHTTGLVTLVFLAALLGKRVRLFGFDFYAAGSHNYWTAQAPAPPLHHELQFEQFYVERFLARLFDIAPG